MPTIPLGAFFVVTILKGGIEVTFVGSHRGQPFGGASIYNELSDVDDERIRVWRGQVLKSALGTQPCVRISHLWSHVGDLKAATLHIVELKFVN